MSNSERSFGRLQEHRVIRNPADLAAWLGESGPKLAGERFADLDGVLQTELRDLADDLFVCDTVENNVTADVAELLTTANAKAAQECDK